MDVLFVLYLSRPCDNASIDSIPSLKMYRPIPLVSSEHYSIQFGKIREPGDEATCRFVFRMSLIINFNNYGLDHVPSSCIVVMVHVVGKRLSTHSATCWRLNRRNGV